MLWHNFLPHDQRLLWTNFSSFNFFFLPRKSENDLRQKGIASVEAYIFILSRRSSSLKLWTYTIFFWHTFNWHFLFDAERAFTFNSQYLKTSDSKNIWVGKFYDSRSSSHRNSGRDCKIFLSAKYFSVGSARSEWKFVLYVVRRKWLNHVNFDGWKMIKRFCILHTLQVIDEVEREVNDVGIVIDCDGNFRWEFLFKRDVR